jgi:hypothetical protein
VDNETEDVEGAVLAPFKIYPRTPRTVLEEQRKTGLEVEI